MFLRPKDSFWLNQNHYPRLLIKYGLIFIVDTIDQHGNLVLLSRVYQGEADIKRNKLTKTHKDKSSSLQQPLFHKNDLLKLPGQEFS
jgi:hypothetical protein